jgi:hypothetical protein
VVADGLLDSWFVQYQQVNEDSTGEMGGGGLVVGSQCVTKDWR